MKKIVFVQEKTATGYSAYAVNFKKYPIGTTAKSVKELKKYLLDATNLYLNVNGKTFTCSVELLER
ncbi:hypothetical protein [Chitinophaga sp. sic0106]|uniref:hypothetical protein n=1 Tax=Chitinophaga sp. sic0106 TaxID=2854785 RepID=UPI001C49455C|nr:hypothetical protein [Chitinophaga sp. sic0106]